MKKALLIRKEGDRFASQIGHGKLKDEHNLLDIVEARSDKVGHTSGIASDESGKQADAESDDLPI